MEWVDEIATRIIFKKAYDKGVDVEVLKGMFSSLIIDRKDDTHVLNDIPPFKKLIGVRMPSKFELAYLSSIVDQTKDGKKNQNYIKKFRKTGHFNDLNSEPLKRLREEEFLDNIDMANEPFELSDVIPRIPVMIDLEQDDESLKLAFELFLEGAREATGVESRKIDEKTLQEWRFYGVLQIFDLQYWAALSGERYTDNVLASAVWGADDVDINERLRKVARPKMVELFQDTLTLERLMNQVQIYEAFISEMPSEWLERIGIGRKSE